MKNLTWIAALAAVTMVAGCNRNSDSTARTDTDDVQPADGRWEGTNLTATSRNERGIPDHDATNTAARVNADNTGKNVRDRNEATLNPEDQSNSPADLDLARRLRQAVSSADQLSATAKNIKIITRDGKVTLRGPVASEQERQTISQIIKQAGVGEIENQLEIKATNQ